MPQNIASAGINDKKIKSDCYVELELTEFGGIEIDLKSKVEKLYGNHIDSLVTEILSFFEINHARVKIMDSGALDFVIAARIEAAIKKLLPQKKSFILPIIDENLSETNKERFRRSRLYLPGNSPNFFINAGIHKPDGIILDLEDSVAPDKKHEARFIVRNALCHVNFYGAERMVRINQIPLGLDDLEYIIPYHVNLILIPKTEYPEQIKEVEARVNELKTIHGIEHPIWYMPIIESAMGVINAYEIASVSDNTVALAIGLEDYTADIGTQRTDAGTESFYARSAIVNAAKAAGIQAIDSVFSDVNNMEALAKTIEESKMLGFEGMGCIHPRQIHIIHKGYAPKTEEIDKAKKIVIAFDDATSKGLGVVSLGSKMIDPPVVKRAQKTIAAAIEANLLDNNWKNTANKE